MTYTLREPRENPQLSLFSTFIADLLSYPLERLWQKKNSDVSAALLRPLSSLLLRTAADINEG